MGIEDFKALIVALLSVVSSFIPTNPKPWHTYSHGKATVYSSTRVPGAREVYLTRESRRSERRAPPKKGESSVHLHIDPSAQLLLN